MMDYESLKQTYREFKDVNPLKASAAISVILLLLRLLWEKETNIRCLNIINIYLL